MKVECSSIDCRLIQDFILKVGQSTNYEVHLIIQVKKLFRGLSIYQQVLLVVIECL